MHFLYLQHTRISSRRGKTVHCEEITDSRVTPTETGSRQQMLSLAGRVLVRKTYVPYTTLPTRKRNDDAVTVDLGSEDDGSMDRDLVENMRNHLLDSRSRDGIGSGLFPLTSKAQANYTFQLIGRERMNRRDTWHVRFQPKDPDEFTWKGDAYIDTEASEPVLVHTTLSRKIPFAVRALLGTNVPGLGYTVTYAPQEGGVWFPSTLGTEFKVHVLFLFHREITMDAENRSFERTHVQSTILGDGTQP